MTFTHVMKSNEKGLIRIIMYVFHCTIVKSFWDRLYEWLKRKHGNTCLWISHCSIWSLFGQQKSEFLCIIYWLWPSFTYTNVDLLKFLQVLRHLHFLFQTIKQLKRNALKLSKSLAIYGSIYMDCKNAQFTSQMFYIMHFFLFTRVKTLSLQNITKRDLRTLYLQICNKTCSLFEMLWFLSFQVMRGEERVCARVI